MRRIAIIESPFEGNEHTSETTHRAYLERLIRHVTLELGCTPYASHKMLADALDDGDAEERMIVLQAGLDLGQQILQWSARDQVSPGTRKPLHGQPRIIFGMDYGTSSGMRLAEEAYRDNGCMARVEHIHIGKNPEETDPACSACGSWGGCSC